ncbi:MAG TPA: MBL fold metallo-hydrolase [Candidatus Saccharimonadales bacterium]|nr:MBL fold metallo-hydrolase [Candidatus Saccharimonadales bacterium]
MNDVQISPISHATMVLQMGGQVIYTDPVNGEEEFEGQPAPTIILVTDIHGDHMNADTLIALSKNNPVIVAPPAVADQLPENLTESIVVLKNGEKTTQKGIEIEAIPMYNIPESPEAFHTKGRGNGYVLSAEGKKVYISGDTSATPEMKALQNIDIAFMTMNLPYTMDIDEAAEAVLAFKPKVVHPYHYRGQDGLSDTSKFKQMVEEKDPSIKVELLNFYPEKK